MAAVEEEAYEEEEGAGGRAYADVDDDERQYAITLEQHQWELNQEHLTRVFCLEWLKTSNRALFLINLLEL